METRRVTLERARLAAPEGWDDEFIIRYGRFDASTGTVEMPETLMKRLEHTEAVHAFQDACFLAIWPLLRPFFRLARLTLKPRWQALADR